MQRTLSNDDEANKSNDVVYDFNVFERRFKCTIKQLLTSKGNELAQTLLKSVRIKYVLQFKNNLVNLKQKAETTRYLPKDNNLIDKCIFVYVNIIRYKLQKETDDNGE